MTTPSLLIEHWLPIEAIGAESKRERGASSALPPLYFLHVWWARRPLTASRAAILASVLPQWSPDWPASLRDKFPSEETYRQWFIHFIGIRGDPVKGRKLVDWAKAKGVKLDYHPYAGAPRAFTVNPSAEDLQTMGDLLEYTWGTHELSVLDPFAGGGSIPFEALRYGFTTIANDLNPVATVILKATIDYPARLGLSLTEDIREWGLRWDERAKEKLADFYPMRSGERVREYFWARTIPCPSTGKPVPLALNWWLQKTTMNGGPSAVELLCDPTQERCGFRVVKGEREVRRVNPNNGTVRRGTAKSPWTNEPIDGDYIKEVAIAGKMGQQLYAVHVRTAQGQEFRSPTDEDLEAISRVEAMLPSQMLKWETEGLKLVEPRYIGPSDRLANYGVIWAEQMFAPRQLLALTTYAAELRRMSDEIFANLEAERASAVVTYLGMVLDKMADYNSRMSVWHSSREVVAHTFGRHDFRFKWSHTEMVLPGNGLIWALEQVIDAYKGIARLLVPGEFESGKVSVPLPDKLHLRLGNAASLGDIEDGAIGLIVVDPPYYDNVIYSECSDFFYVWMKRTLNHVFKEWFVEELTNKDDEAVANFARFSNMGRKKKDLAEQDYERKMAAAFREMYRVLRPEGALTVMFTHKRVEAWDTLASALIGAGFAIKASWPVHTESEHSLHQAEKNAASSTILLVCRKRTPTPSPSPVGDRGGSAMGAVWWDDLQPHVRETARQKAQEFAAIGISGVDLYISTFGPTLSIISEHWPVLTSEVDEKTGQPKPLRPETALDLAREEVVRLRKQGLLLGRDVQFDPVTDWYIMAWDAFGAEQFPYDEARKLAIALGLDLDKSLMRTNRLVTKKGEYVVMQTPVQRRRKGVVDDEVTSFEHLIDAVHTAMMVYEEDGAGACDVFLRKSGLKTDSAFKACLQALLNAIPRARVKGKFVRPEAEVLENLRLAFFDDLQAPVEQEPEMPQPEQLGLEGFEDKSDQGEERQW